MDAAAYQVSFDKEQLALLCANYDRRIDSLSAENKRLKAENDKLRKLVAIGLRCCDFKCDGCRFNKHNACYVGEFEDEARKLGVEVNG